MISASVRSNASHLSDEFARSGPFRHVVIDDFFESASAEKLLSEFPPFSPDHARNEFGEVGRKAVVSDIASIGPTYRAVHQYLGSADFLKVISGITSIPDLLHDERMFGGGTHENLDGQELDPHVDFNYLEDRKLHRRLNLLLYLNKEWEPEWGGCLELHSDPRHSDTNHVKVVPPLFNRAVIFETTEGSWHGFEAIRLPDGKQHLSRKLLSIYLYTRDRPADEIAPPHGTFYIQRSLPAHLVAGYTLTDADARLIRDACIRRDAWIEHYQRKEVSDSGRIQDLTASLRASLRAPLIGYALQEGPVEGYWPDGWIASPFSVSLRLFAPTTGLTMNGFAPEQLETPLTLRIGVNDREPVTHRVNHGAFCLPVGASAGSGEVLKLTIRTDKTYRPSAHATDSPDARDLAVVVTSLRVLHP